MTTLAEFFQMGGYAFYVWSSYLIALVVLIINLWLPFAKMRQVKRKLSRQILFQQAQADRRVSD